MLRSSDSSPGGSSVSADLDAYRRNRYAVPPRQQLNLIQALEEMQSSSQPRVTFSRLANICVPTFADICEIHLADGAEPALNLLVTVDRATARQQRQPEARRPLRKTVEVPFERDAQGDQPSYAGVFTLAWFSRSPEPAEQVIAELLISHAAGLVERQRLLDRVGASETRAAATVMEIITSRQVNLAIGLLMGQTGRSAEAAESMLRDTAVERGSELYSTAAELVRANHLILPERRNDTSVVPTIGP